MSSDEDEGDGRRYNRYESDDEGDVEGTYDEDAWNDSRKRRRGQTKEQAIYGIFGDDDDDGDDRDDRGAPVDYTAPVNFKSAGGTGGGGAGLGAGKEPEGGHRTRRRARVVRVPGRRGAGLRGLLQG